MSNVQQRPTTANNVQRPTSNAKRLTSVQRLKFNAKHATSDVPTSRRPDVQRPTSNVRTFERPNVRTSKRPNVRTSRQTTADCRFLLNSLSRHGGLIVCFRAQQEVCLLTGNLATRKLLATIWRPRQSLMSRAQQKVSCVDRPFSAGCLWRPRQSLVFRTPQVVHAPVGNAKHIVTLTKHHTRQHFDAAFDSATQLFDTNITTLVTQTPEPTMKPLAKRHKVASPLERVTDGEYQSTNADELDVLTPHAGGYCGQSDAPAARLRPTPRGRPEATHEREAPGAHHTPATGPSK